MRRPAKWWALAREWDVEARTLPHGQVEPALLRFADAHGLRPISVRKAAAAAAFAAEAQRSGQVAKARLLRTLPLTYVEVLQRVSRYGWPQADAVAARLLARTMNGPSLRAAERAIREERPPDEALARDAHAARLGGSTFATAALRALASAYPAPARCVAVPAALRRRMPVPCDAVVLVGRALLGARFVPAGSRRDAAGSNGALVALGLAGARLFESYLLVAEQSGQAAELAHALASCGPCGAGVLWLPRGQSASTVMEPARLDAGPDLAAALAPLVAGLFPPVA